MVIWKLLIARGVLRGPSMLKAEIWKLRIPVRDSYLQGRIWRRHHGKHHVPRSGFIHGKVATPKSVVITGEYQIYAEYGGLLLNLVGTEGEYGYEIEAEYGSIYGKRPNH